MKNIILLFLLGLFSLSCASIKTYRDDLKGATKYYTDDFSEWGAFLNIVVYDNEPNKPIIALEVRTQALLYDNYLSLREVYFFDDKTKENISFKLDDAKHDLVYQQAVYTGYTYIPSAAYKIAKGTKFLNNTELDLLYNFMTNSQNTKIRFYGDYQVDNPLPSGQKKNIIQLIEKYKKELK